MSKPVLVVAVNQSGRTLAVPGPEGLVTLKPGAISEPLDRAGISEAAAERLAEAGVAFLDPKSKELAAIRKEMGKADDADLKAANAELTAEVAALKRQVANLTGKVDAAKQIGETAAALEKRNGELEAELAEMKAKLAKAE